VASFENFRNTFSGEFYKDAIWIEARLGADGELFDQTIVYTLRLDLGNAFSVAEQITQTSVERVRTANGSASDASFESGASADGGTTSGTNFTTSDNVTIVGTINIDPEDQGMPGDIYVALLSATTEGVLLSFMNEDGNYESWDQTLPGLGAHISTDTLSDSYVITISSGTLLAGTFRVVLAYSRGSKFIYAPKAITIKVN